MLITSIHLFCAGSIVALNEEHDRIIQDPHSLQFMEHPADLAEHRCLIYSLLKDPYNWTFTDDRAKEHNVKVNAFMKASAGDFMRAAAVEGHGIVNMPTFIVYKEIERGALVPILTDYKTWQVNAYAIYPQTRHLSQRVRSFVDFLVDRFKGTPYWDHRK
jgi:DNA-binding transcriptional LysR family regulator